jgi:hypothetical protein
MLQPKRAKKKSLLPASEAIEERTQARKQWGIQLEDAGHRYPSDGKRRLTPTHKLERTSKIEKRSTPQLKTKKATPVTTSPLNNERVAQASAKPKMKTLKGKIQKALMKAKKG